MPSNEDFMYVFDIDDIHNEPLKNALLSEDTLGLDISSEDGTEFYACDVDCQGLKELYTNIEQ